MKLSNWKSSLALAGLLTIHAGILNAATCSVPSAGYPTIQAAVDDSTCDTINVAPGVYAENINIARTVVLNGSQAGQSIASRVSGGPAESVLVRSEEHTSELQSPM